MAIKDWMPILRERIGELDGLDGGVRDYTDIPSKFMEFPVALILPRSGEIEYSVGLSVEFTNVMIIIVTAATVLPESFSLAVPFIARIRDKIAGNLQLDNTVENIMPIARPAVWYEGPGVIEFGGMNLTGITFFYTVKEDVSGDFTVKA